MGGGLMQLVAYGAQDIYLSGKMSKWEGGGQPSGELTKKWRCVAKKGVLGNERIRIVWNGGK